LYPETEVAAICVATAAGFKISFAARVTVVPAIVNVPVVGPEDVFWALEA
jgi:hypothetical protein